MVICPNCSSPDLAADEMSCSVCGWRGRDLEGVKDYFTDLQRTDRLQKAYVENYNRSAEINLDVSDVDRTFLRKQARNLVSYLGDVEGLTICEVGIGQGFLCRELIAGGVARIVGVDVAETYLRRFVDDPHVEPYLANAETLPFADAFDLIVSSDVAEHVLNVGSYLYCANRALVAGGRIAIRVPYREGLLNYSPHCGYDYQFGHLRSFDKNILRVCLEQAGFRVDSMHLEGFSPYMPRPWAMKYEFGRNLIRRLQDYVDRNLNHWSDVADLPRPIVFALLRPVEIVVVARKVAALAPSTAVEAGNPPKSKNDGPGKSPVS